MRYLIVALPLLHIYVLPSVRLLFLLLNEGHSQGQKTEHYRAIQINVVAMAYARVGLAPAVICVLLCWLATCNGLQTEYNFCELYDVTGVPHLIMSGQPALDTNSLNLLGSSFFSLILCLITLYEPS